MTSPCAAAARTYARKLFLLPLPLMGLHAVLILGRVRPEYMTFWLLLSMLFWGVAGFAFCVGLHLRQQFAHPRSVTVPRFRVPHAGVGGAAVTAAVAASALALGAFEPRSLLGPLSVLASGGTIAVCLGFELFVLVWVALFFALTALAHAPGFLGGLYLVVIGDADAAAWLLLTACAAAWVALGRQLLWPGEDLVNQPARGLADELDLGPRALRRRRAVARSVPVWWLRDPPGLSGVDPLQRALDRLGGSRPADLPARVRLWTLGSCPALSSAVAVVLFLEVAVFLVMVFVSWWKADSLEEAMAITVSYPWGPLSACLAPGALAACWPYLGTEALKPWSRTEFVRELGRQALVETCRAWVLCHVCLAVLVALAAPSYLLRAQDVGVYLLLSGAGAVCCFAVGMLVASYRGLLPWGLFALFLGLAGLFTTLWGTYLTDRGWRLGLPAYLGLAAAVTAASPVVLALARRRWCAVDLD